MPNTTHKLWLALCASVLATAGLGAQAASASKTAPITPLPTVTQPAVQPVIQPAPAPQAAPAPAAAQLPIFVDGNLLFFDIGVTMGYSLTTNAPVIGRGIGLSMVVSDALSVGFASLTAGATNYDLFRLGYSFAKLVGAEMYIGTDGSAAAGIGAFLRIKPSVSDPGISTALKLRLGYFFDTTGGLTSGNIVLCIGSSVGI